MSNGSEPVPFTARHAEILVRLDQKFKDVVEPMMEKVDTLWARYLWLLGVVAMVAALAGYIFK